MAENSTAKPPLSPVRYSTWTYSRQSGARLVIVPQIPGALAGTADYFQWMDHLVGSVADALSATASK